MQDKFTNQEEITPTEQTNMPANENPTQIPEQDAQITDTTTPDFATEVNDTLESSTAPANDAPPQTQGQETQENLSETQVDNQPPAPEAQEQATASGYAAQQLTDPAQQLTDPAQQPMYTPEPITYPKKTGKKVLAFVVAAVVILTLAAGTAYAFFRNEINKMILSNEKYFAYVESKNMSKGTNYVVDMLSAIANPTSNIKDSSANAKFSFFLDSEELEMPELGFLAEILNKCQIDITTNIKKGIGASTIINLVSENDTVVTLEGYEKDDKVIVRIPQLSDKYLIVPNDTSQYLSTIPSTSSTMFYNLLSTKIEFDETKLKKSLKGIVDVIVNNMGEVEITSDSYTIGDITKNVDIMTVELKEKDFYNLLIKVSEQIKEDKYFKELFTANLGDSFNAGLANIYYDQIINIMISQFKGAMENATDKGTLKYQSFVDKKGKIVGRSINFSDDYTNQTIEYFDFTDKSNSATVFNIISHNQNSFALENKSTISAGKHTGTLVVEADNQKLFTIKYTDLILKDNDLTGTIEVVDIMDFPYTIKLEATDDKLEISLNGNKKLASVSIAAEESKLKDFQMPDLTEYNSVDFQDLEKVMEWSQTVDIESFALEILGKLGLSDEAIQELILSFYGSLSEDDYDLDDYDYDFEDYDFDDFDFSDFDFGDFDFESMHAFSSPLAIVNLIK